MPMELGKDAKLTIAITTAAGVAAQTAINGATLDMSGWESVLMVINFGVIDATAVTTIKAQQDAASGMGGAADLIGTLQTIGAADDEKTFYIDLVKPLERFVRLVVSRGTADAVVGGATYIQYRGRKSPSAHGTNVAGETHISPIEGPA